MHFSDIYIHRPLNIAHCVFPPLTCHMPEFSSVFSLRVNIKTKDKYFESCEAQEKEAHGILKTEKIMKQGTFTC